jgi:predicted dienelactone hydrolase
MRLSPISRFVAVSIAITSLAAARWALADPLATAEPLPGVGPYAVGCSNVEQDFTRLRAGESAVDYWEGTPDGSRDRYVTQLLLDPADALVINVNVPDDRELYPTHATLQVPYVVIVCYPTAANNPNQGYTLTTASVVPHMQRGPAPPIWTDATTRWPVLLFSHGLTGSPLSSDYISAVSVLASYGYVVVAPFHGDPRFADFDINNLSDALYALLHFPEYIEMQAIRALSMKTALDQVLARPEYAAHIDTSRIGGFGASLGAETLLLQAGAKLTTTVGLASKQVISDPRLGAIVGYVPYFGQPILPAFGRDQNGLDGVKLPFLGIAGFSDTTAPLATIAQGVLRLTDSRELVALEGVGHYFDFPSAPDIFTWTLTFLAAHVNDDRDARAQIARMISVRGGGDDRLLVDYTAPAADAATERDVIEYYNASLNHYFLTADAAEAAMLDAGNVVAGWTRTGYNFKSWTLDAQIGAPACRFFGTPGIGPNSHFYTIDANECAVVKTSPYWQFEGNAFAEQAPTAGNCAPGQVPVTRLYNNGLGGQANHRYLTSHSETTAMLGKGWLVEGTVFCAAP